MTTLTSPAGSLQFGPGLPTLLINDQLRVIDQDPAVLEDLQHNKIEKVIELAQWGWQTGLPAADILIAHPELDEVDLLPRIVHDVTAKVGCCISLDSRNPEALEAALQELKPYKALINSVPSEAAVMDELLPLAAKYGAAVVGIPVGAGKSMPHTVEGRLEEARIILGTAQGYGVPAEDVVLDAICLATAAEPDSMRVTLQTLAAFESQLGVSTVLGIGNAGHGMPTPTWIDLAYLLAAIPWGLHAALVNPAIQGLMEVILAADFLLDRDPYGRRYISHYRKNLGITPPTAQISK